MAPPERNPELRALLREKLRVKQIDRSSKANRDRVLEGTLKTLGIDKTKLEADIEAVKKEGNQTELVMKMQDALNRQPGLM